MSKPTFSVHQTLTHDLQPSLLSSSSALALTAPPTGRLATLTFMKYSQSSLEQTGFKCQVKFPARGILVGKINSWQLATKVVAIPVL